MTPMLPYTESDDNLNLMLYDSNGQLYGKLKGGSYLVVLSYMEHNSKFQIFTNLYYFKKMQFFLKLLKNDLGATIDTKSIDFRLRFVAPDIQVRKIYAPSVTVN